MAPLFGFVIYTVCRTQPSEGGGDVLIMNMQFGRGEEKIENLAFVCVTLCTNQLLMHAKPVVHAGNRTST